MPRIVFAGPHVLYRLDALDARCPARKSRSHDDGKCARTACAVPGSQTGRVHRQASDEPEGPAFHWKVSSEAIDGNAAAAGDLEPPEARISHADPEMVS